MRRVSALFSFDENILKESSKEPFLEDAINVELGWLHDSGIFANVWSFIPNKDEIRVWFDVDELSLYTSASDTNFNGAFASEAGWIQDSGLYLEEFYFVPVPEKIDLHSFLEIFDFDYEVISYDETDEYEIDLRADFTEEEKKEPMLSLIDRQGLYLGDIGEDRFLLRDNLVEKIIERMDTYVNDYIIEDFKELLHDHKVYTDDMDLEDMYLKAKELDINEAGFTIAAHIIHPESIEIEELVNIKEAGKTKVDTKLCDKINMLDSRKKDIDTKILNKSPELQK